MILMIGDLYNMSHVCCYDIMGSFFLQISDWPVDQSVFSTLQGLQPEEKPGREEFVDE